MVDVEIRAREPLTAVLTRVSVAGVDVVAAEPHLSLGHSIVGQQQDHSGHPNGTPDKPDRVIMHRHRQLAPARKIKGLVLLVHRVCDVLIKKAKGPTHRCDVNGQEGSVKNQNLRVEN
jgi:hypothetical protein